MNWKFICDMDCLTFELECALDNLHAVHTVMTSEEGANWEMRCNALYSTYLQLCNIQAQFTRYVDQAVTEERERREMD